MAHSIVILRKATNDSERILASRGTAVGVLMVTESLGFMTTDQRLVELRKLPLVPLWRRRVMKYWEGDRPAALRSFEEAGQYL
jgi:hypothetical protein